MRIIKENTSSDICSHIVKYDAKSYDFHWHDKFEICQVLNNYCSFLVDGKVINAKVGDIITIKEQISHRFIIENDDTLIRITQFPVKILLDMSSAIKPIKEHITSEEINSINGLKENINFFFDIMEKEGNIEKIKDKPFVKSVYASLYFLLMRYFPEEVSSGTSKNERKEFFKITEYINEHFKENLNFDDIASKLFVSRRKLPELFYKYSGTQLNDYINTLRIKNANQLLREGNNITEAAYESGFQSIRTFNFVYKACMGITPTQYIKEYINSKSRED